MSTRILAGRYELIEKIGEGGMAVVYKARCRLLNRNVAIKILKPEFTKDAKFIDSFRRESQAAASLSHPNIVNIYDVGKEGNIYYIVMELIEGQVLSDIVRDEGPLEYHRAVDIVKQIASALSFAHRNQIIHRDVKPHNILITQDGIAKITDFGIAKAVNTGTIVGDAGAIMGSVHYFSPEQARGGYVDEKSDIYSLGIVLYELLTGKVPFDAENPVTVALMHMNEDMDPPSKHNPDIPPALEAVVLKATDKFQVNRYKSADEMLEALSGIDDEKAVPLAGYGAGAAAAAGADGIEEDTGDMRTKEKDRKGNKKRKINIVKVIAVILALACAIPVSQLVLSALQQFNAPKEVAVPDLAGMSVEQATAELENYKLALKIGSEVNSDEYAAGQIVSQDPPKDMSVKEGYTITVNVSKGKEVVKDKQPTVPAVTNRSVKDAEVILETYGYVLGRVDTQYSDMPKDIIIRQSPESGTAAEAGSSVSVVVSLGQAVEYIPMPNLIGMNIDKAKQKLETSGLSLDGISYEASDKYEADTVIWQQYEADVLMEKDTKVNLKVSTGIEEEHVSTPVTLTIDYGSAANEVFLLTVVVSDETGVSTVIDQAERLKSNGSETLSLSGVGKGTVRVIFDNEVVMERACDFTTGEPE